MSAPRERAASDIPVICALGTTQTLAWASSYYLPAILADAIARDLGVPTDLMFGVFSGALVISALLGPQVGRQIDRMGGRGVLSLSSIVLAAGLLTLASANSVTTLVCAWLLLGVGMSLGLYDAAFGALGRVYGDKARRAITGITLFAGFASTVGWPLTAWGQETIGWRSTCVAWALAHLLIGLPLNLTMLPKIVAPQRPQTAPRPRIRIDTPMIVLAVAFAAAGTVSGAMAAHLPRILQAAGATTVQAVAAGALIGPAQVLARVVEANLLSRLHPLTITRIACMAHPMGAALLSILGGSASWLFAVCHGGGNGILTISRGTVPLAIFGPENYAYRLGLIGAPARFAQALAPLGFSLLLDRYGGAVLIISSGLSMVAVAALLLIRPRKAPVQA